MSWAGDAESLAKQRCDKMTKGQADLEWLLDYEVRSSVRYRRFLSIVLAACIGGRNAKELAWSNTLRESDARFEVEDGIAIVMGETDRLGALVAVERLRRRCGEGADVRFAVVSFPVDGYIASDLLATAYRRVNRAKTLHPGAIVATG